MATSTHRPRAKSTPSKPGLFRRISGDGPRWKQVLRWLALLFVLGAVLLALGGARMETLQAESFPQTEIIVHEAAETGAAYGAACMLHQRFLSLDNDLFAEDPTKTPEMDEA